MKFKIAIAAGLIAIAAIGCGGGEKRSDDSGAQRFITIGTGNVTGVYYPTGGAIAKIINRASDRLKIKATAEATGGSVFNINAVMSGDLEFGIAQSDRQFQAVNGLAEWEGRPLPGLRSVFSLHSESVTFVATDPSGIWSPEQVRGKRVAIGNIGSGHRQNAIDALSAYGVSLNDFQPEDLKPSECAAMLQDGRIDGYFYTVGHPNGSIKEAIAGTKPVHFVPIERIDSLLIIFPYYTRDTISIMNYEGVTNKTDIPTFGVKATIVTSEKVAESLVYEVVRELFEHLDEFVALHPALENLTREKMLQGLTAPLHPGAERYYRETGLMP